MAFQTQGQQNIEIGNFSALDDWQKLLVHIDIVVKLLKNQLVYTCPRTKQTKWAIDFAAP